MLSRGQRKMNRREFCTRVSATTMMLSLDTSLLRADVHPMATTVNVAAIDRTWVIPAANKYMTEAPRTITAAHCERSPGGEHDFFSEGDYWWPDPKNPSGPYIRRDGQSNPDNFDAHRDALRRMSIIVPTLTSAWKITGEKKYAAKTREHLIAWFVAPATRINPNLQYAQAIKGVSTGRGTGIIDTVHLVEVARAIQVLDGAHVWASSSEREVIHTWFHDYVGWMTTSKNGIEERDAKNNHGSCWVLQVAAFSRLIGDKEKMRYCAELFKTKLIPEQIAQDGSLPLELARTKPYSYSLFDMDILSDICQTLSPEVENIWAFETSDGRGMRKVIAYMVPFIADKKKWPLKPDVEYFNDLPVRQPSLLFGGIAYKQPEWIALWKSLNPEPTVTEIIRSFPVRQPLLWV
jgi:Alginate lyase